MTSRHFCTIISLLLLLIFIFSTSINAQQPSDSTTSDDDYAIEGSRVNPSMALIVIVLVLAFFITGCISIYIQLCTDNNSIGGQSAGIRTNNQTAVNLRGLDQSLLDTFPTFLYSDVKELKFGKESLECAVCLNEFEGDETLRLLPKCDHVFHSECIDAWLSAHSTCPVCRANLVVADDSAESTHLVEGESGPSYEVEVIVVPELPKGRVLRWNSTGHVDSVSRLGEGRERFTLRLPDEVRRQLLLVARPKLKRTISMVALPRVSSSRRGYRNGGDGSGSSRYGRFFGRSFKWTTRNNGGDGEGSIGSKRFLGTVVKPLEALPTLPV